MSPRSATIRDHIVNAVITAIATLFLTHSSALWNGKESVAAHNADVQRILDVLCEIKPQARACTKMDTASGEVAQR